MMRRVLVVSLALALPSVGGAMELVINGDFETDPALDWKEDLAGAATLIDWATTYDADPDYEVLVQKGTGNGHAKLEQTIVIPSTDIDVSAELKMVVSTSTGPWSAAGMALHYEDSFGAVLGSTVIVGRTSACPWVDGEDFHMIEAPDELWNPYELNVGDELANLPGVDMMAVHQIRISLFGQVGGDC